MGSLGAREKDVREDAWALKPDPNKGFSVGYACDNLFAFFGIKKGRSERVVLGLSRIWKGWSPSKVVVFSWELIQNRRPIRKNLLRRQVVSGSSNEEYVVCVGNVDSVNHLFVLCEFASASW
ncbi:unnamed protein product [Lathyrus oleraceus]